MRRLAIATSRSAHSNFKRRSHRRWLLFVSLEQRDLNQGCYKGHLYIVCCNTLNDCVLSKTALEERESGRVRKRGERRGEKRGGRGQRGETSDREEEILSDIFHIPLYTFIYLIYLYIPSNTPKYLYILSYTPIYFKISDIRKMRINIRHKNGHNSGPTESPRVRIWHIGSYHVPRGSATPKGAQF